MPGYLGDLYEKELDLWWRRNQPTSGDDDPNNNNNNNINSSKNLIKRVGKPFPDVYDLVLKQYVHENIPKSRVVMVGDALETDVVGGTLAGIDTAWVVLDGIHSPDVRAMEVDEEATTLEESCQRIVEQFNARSEDTYARGQALMPTFVLPHFRW